MTNNFKPIPSIRDNTQRQKPIKPKDESVQKVIDFLFEHSEITEKQEPTPTNNLFQPEPKTLKNWIKKMKQEKSSSLQDI